MRSGPARRGRGASTGVSVAPAAPNRRTGRSWKSASVSLFPNDLNTAPVYDVLRHASIQSRHARSGLTASQRLRPHRPTSSRRPATGSGVNAPLGTRSREGWPREDVHRSDHRGFWLPFRVAHRRSRSGAPVGPRDCALSALAARPTANSGRSCATSTGTHRWAGAAPDEIAQTSVMLCLVASSMSCAIGVRDGLEDDAIALLRIAYRFWTSAFGQRRPGRAARRRRRAGR